MKKTLMLLFICIISNFASSQSWRNYSSNDEVYNVTISKNILYASTSGGLIEYDLQAQKQLILNTQNNKILSGRIDHVANDKDGNIYLCSSSIYKYDGSSVVNLNPLPDPLTLVLDSDLNPNGEIWFVELWDGILIYNGSEWKQLDSSNSGFPSKFCRTVRHDNKGNMWIGTQNGLVKYDGKIFTSITKSNTNIPDESIQDIAVDKDNNIWLAAINSILKYDGSVWSVFNRSDIGTDMNFLCKVTVDSSGNIWAGDLINGLSKYDGNTWKYYSSFRSKKLNDINADKDGNVWVSTNIGLYKIKDDQVEKIDFSGSSLPSNAVSSFSFDSYGRTWVTTDQAAGYIKDNTFYKLLPENYGGVQHNYYCCSTIDSLGNVWLGYSGGVLKFDNEKIVDYKWLNSSVPDPNISCMTTDKDGNVWVGYQGTLGGVFKISGSDWTVYNIASTGIQIKGVTDVICSDDNTIWVATCNDGIFKFSDNKWVNYNTINSLLPSNYVNCLAIDKNGKLFIGTEKGAVLFDGIAILALNSMCELSFKQVKDISFDNNGALWSTIPGYGLLKYEGTGFTAQYIPGNSDIVTQNLKKINVDRNNNVWMASDYGISEFNENIIIESSPRKPQLFSPRANQKDVPRELRLEWYKFNYTDKYLIHISTDNKFNNMVFIDSTYNDTTKSISTLLDGQKYYWMIKAVGANSTSEWSYIWNFTTVLSAPTDLVLERSSLSEITLTWKVNSINENGYIIEKKESSQSTFNILDTLKGKLHKYVDTKVEQGKAYSYRIKAFNDITESAYSNESSLNTVGVKNEKTPVEYSLSQNYPNPFNPTTTISFSIPSKSYVSLKVFDALGRGISTLISEELKAGTYSKQWNASNLSSGVYYYRLQTRTFTDTKNLILLR